MTKMKLSTKQKQTHRHREQIWGCQERGRMEWEFGVRRCKLLQIELTTRSYCIAQEPYSIPGNGIEMKRI